MALEGVCEIELRDEQGNVVQRTRDKNMVTNGLSLMINQNSKLRELFFSSSEDYCLKSINRMTPILENLIGGCFIFNKTNNENVNNIIPDPKSIVAMGSLSKTIIDDSRIGMCNFDESKNLYNEDGKIIGIKYVWDFATNRGNGTIKSISLTTDIGARSGYKNGDFGLYYIYNNSSGGLYYNGFKSFNIINPILEIKNKNQEDSNFRGENPYIYGYSLFKNGLIGIIDEYYFIINGHNSNDKKIIIEKHRLKNEIKLNDDIYKIVQPETNQWFYNSLEFIASFELDVSDVPWFFLSPVNYHTESIEASMYTYKGYIYFASAYDNEIKIKKINPNTMTIVENISKTFEQGGLNKYNSNNYSTPICIYNNYYLVMQYDENNKNTHLLILNQDDLTIKKSINIGKDGGTSKDAMSPAYFGYIDEYLYIRIKTSSTMKIQDGNAFIIDKELNYTSINEKFLLADLYPIETPIYKYPYLLCRKINNYSVSDRINQVIPVISSHIMFTIDNLATPVTKTASQTMKVIYTIKDVEETV